MKKIWNTLIFAFIVFCLFLVRPRQDIVFGAVDKSQYIRLFENGKDFELCMEENQTFFGTYSIAKDTVFLSYREHLNQTISRQNIRNEDYNKVLPAKLLINEGAANIMSSEGSNAFSAQIYLDMRNKSHETAPNNLRILKDAKANILASGSLK